MRERWYEIRQQTQAGETHEHARDAPQVDRPEDEWPGPTAARGNLALVSLCMVAAPAQQKTARSIAEHGKARLAPGPTGDVVIINAVLEGLIGVDNVPEDSPSASPLRLIGIHAAQAQSTPTWRFDRSGSRPGARKTSRGPHPHARRSG